MKGGSFSAICVILMAGTASACTEFFVGKDVSADGSWILARTVDSPPWNGSHRCQVTPHVENVPGRTFVHPGNRFTWPLPATTWKFVSTPRLASIQKNRASACANEKGFVITGTVTAHPRKEWEELDPYNKETAPGENSLPELLAACCATAREALDLTAKIIAERGHDGGEIYTFADKDEAWLVEVYTGHLWAAVRLPPDKVSVFGNQFMIGSFDPSSPDVRFAKDLISLPERLGKLVRGADGLPDLYATYSGPLGDYANYRTWFAHEKLAKDPLGEYKTSRRVPFLFTPSHKVTVKELFALSRTRYEGTDWNPEETGKLTSRTIGTTKQMSCHVIQLHPDLPPAFAGTIWVALGNAEHIPYLPMNAAITEVDRAFGADQEKGPYRFDVQIAGHAFRRLATLAELNRKWYGAGVRAYWEKREDELLASYPEILRKCALQGGDAAGLTAYCCREQARAYADALRIFDDLMWYAVANNRISGDGSGATDLPPRPFEAK